MSLLDTLKNTILGKINTATDEYAPAKLDYFTVFGVLLYEVAAVSDGVSEEELKVIKEVMQQELQTSESGWEYIYQAVKEAANRDINLRRFTAEFNSNTDYETRKDLLDSLLKVASADGIVEKVELDRIKWIAKFLWITPKDFNGIKEKYRSFFE